jgi:hypothetical protein
MHEEESPQERLARGFSGFPQSRGIEKKMVDSPDQANAEDGMGEAKV